MPPAVADPGVKQEKAQQMQSLQGALNDLRRQVNL